MLPFGRAKKTREGDEITIVTWGAMVPRCEAAAEGVSADVIDLRTLQPWDREMVLDSVRRTRRCLIVHEDLRTGGFGAEIAAVVADEAFLDLDAPVARVTMPDIPSPHHPKLMEWALPVAEQASAPRSSGWWGSDLIEVRVPDEQEGTKAVVRAWLKQIGDAVAENDPLVELETDKVTQEVPAPAAGVLAEIVLDTDAEAVPGALLARIETDGTPAKAGAQDVRSSACLRRDAAADAAPGPRPSPGNREDAPHPLRPPRLPAARHRPVAHPGHRPQRAGHPRGRRPRRRAGDHRQRRRARNRAAAAILAAGHPARPHAAHHRREHGPRGRPRRRTSPPCSKPISPRSRRTRRRWRQRGVKLSYTAYIVKAAAEAMAVAPAINGRWEKDRIAISPTIDIGVGTALGEKGLVVPVVKDAGSLSLEQIGARLDDLTRRARDGKLERSDVSGGSFTISNHGVSGSLLAAPIILHQGQAAILGVGKLEKRVVVREVDGEDAILIRPMAYVTLTIDHRVVDGHQTNAWLTRFVEILENWPAA